MWISRKKFDELVELANATVASIEAAKTAVDDAAMLVQIERKGRVNQFVFARRGELHTIETYSTISDDLPVWKEKLLR